MEKIDALKLLGQIQTKQLEITNSIRKQQNLKSEVKSLGQKISELQKDRDALIITPKLKSKKLKFDVKTKNL